MSGHVFSLTAASYLLDVQLLLPSARGKAMDAAGRMAELQAALAQENRMQIRACQQRVRQEERNEQHGGLSCAAVRKVLAVYSLSSWRLDVAVLAAKQLAPGLVKHITPEFIRKLFREHNLEDLLQMHEENHRAWLPARRFAERFLVEHSAWCWVKRMNVAQGVAPSAASVFHWYQRSHGGLAPTGLPAKRTINTWVARWRKRWGVQRACLRAADEIEPAVLQEKAGEKTKT